MSLKNKCFSTQFFSENCDKFSDFPERPEKNESFENLNIKCKQLTLILGFFVAILFAILDSLGSKTTNKPKKHCC